MTPLEMIKEWRKGCSCAPEDSPEQCHECTAALIDAIERECQRLLAIESAARNLVVVKGRHHSAIAYQRLVDAIAK